MPQMDRPPMAPQAQAQMGAPGGPGFGPGIGQAQQQMDKSPSEVAVGTVEKILMGLQSEAMRPYAMKAIATLKVGLAMEQKQGPQSAGMSPALGPVAAQHQPPMPMPPMPGQMPG